MVGLPGFEPESIEPKSTSLDQASREPHNLMQNHNFIWTIKTLAKPNSELNLIPAPAWILFLYSRANWKSKIASPIIDVNTGANMFGA